jgi:predicted O-methyltransferase YrrM
VSTFRTRVARRLFNPLQRVGFHLTPVDFYSPIPNTTALDAWSLQGDPDWSAHDQIERLTRLATAYGADLSRDLAGYDFRNPMFGPGDTRMLYLTLRDQQPARVIEVGSGYSSIVVQAALRANGRGHHVAIDPYPSALAAPDELQAIAVQNLEPAFFDQLSAGDVLFIDSSHVCTVGSDVRFLFRDVLPRLQIGVVVHLHDVFLPDEYPRPWVVGEQRFWNEQYVLEAFLAFNRSFEVLWSANWLGTRFRDRVAAWIEPGGGSFWMRRVQ